MRLIALAILLAVSLPLAARDWTVDAQHSHLGFQGVFQDQPFSGEFKQFAAQIRFDPADLAQAKFDVAVTTKSADAGDADRNATLATPDFFYPDRFPLAHFITKGFRALGGGKFEADAELTIRDQTHPLKFPFSWSATAGAASLKAEVELDRIDYDIGGGEWADDGTIGHRITVSVDLALKSL